MTTANADAQTQGCIDIDKVLSMLWSVHDYSGACTHAITGTGSSSDAAILAALEDT